MTKLKRGPIPGLPDSTLAECLFITAKRKAGKSYLQRLAFERALTKGLRTGWIDAMGIGWGVTVQGDPNNLEKPIGPGFDVVVFGGAHAHVPLSPTAGAALGMKLAKATFSWVLDISGFKSKAERVRFMAAFMEAIYEFTSSQLLLFVDEIDLWAPQMVMDKQGPIMQLLGTMDEIVRRGRIKGLVVWMATQRPAVVNLSIRSQAECFIAMKTTAPQDIDAIMSWLKFHLKKENFQEQMARFPALHQGQGMVYMTEPEISISEAQFPLILTLDTMTPRSAGERAQSDKLGTKPDIAAITRELGDLEEKLKADDPAFLKAENARLKTELAKKPATISAPVADVAREFAARADGYGVGYQEGFQRGWITGHDAGWRQSFDASVHRVSAAAGQIPPKVRPPTDFKVPDVDPTRKPVKTSTIMAPARNTAAIAPSRAQSAPEGITGPQRKVLNALAWWKGLGNDAPAVAMIAVICGWRPSSTSTSNRVSELVTAGLVERRTAGNASLTIEGTRVVVVPQPGSQAELTATIRSVLTGPQVKVIEALTASYPDEMAVGDVADAAGWERTSTSTSNRVSELVTMSMATRPRPGYARAADWLFI